MASGVNTTFRQIGIATAIAAYGSIFASSIQHQVGQTLISNPSLGRHLPGVVTAIQQGNAAQAINAVPAPWRAPLVAAIHASFASALDVLLLVSAAPVMGLTVGPRSDSTQIAHGPVCSAYHLLILDSGTTRSIEESEDARCLTGCGASRFTSPGAHQGTLRTRSS